MKKETARRSGMGFIGTLTLVLAVLKLFNLIDWSWAWVLSPLWIPALPAAAVFSAILISGRMKKGKW